MPAQQLTEQHLRTSDVYPAEAENLHVQSCRLRSLQEDHLDRLRRPRRAGPGQRPGGETMHLRLTGRRCTVCLIALRERSCPARSAGTGRPPSRPAPGRAANTRCLCAGVGDGRRMPGLPAAAAAGAGTGDA